MSKGRAATCRAVAVCAAILLACGCAEDAGLELDARSEPDVGGDALGDLPDGGPEDPVDVAGEPDAIDAVTPSDATDATDTPDAEEPAPAPVPPERPEISAARLQALVEDLTEILADPSVEGRELSALVVESESGTILFESGPDQPLVPASNTKLFTTAAALAMLGEDYRFETRVFAGVDPDGSGVIDGDLYLVATHDFTFSSDFYVSARFPLDRLAEALSEQGVRQVDGTVWVLGELVYDGYPTGDYDPESHRAAAAAAFRAALLDAGIAVGAADTAAEFEPPEGAVELTEWQSAPLSVGCSRINRVSHNEYADALLRHLGWVYGGQSSDAAGAAVVRQWLGEQGVDVTGLVLTDGSGLSYDNRVSARQVVSLFRWMIASPLGRTWIRTLSVAGVRGTLANRMTGPDTAGRVFGKTGTLSIAIATSGLLVNRHDGRGYLFSFIMNHQPDNASARAVQDRAIEALAVDLLDSGVRPDPPELTWVANDGDADGVTAGWDRLDDAEGYFVWVSSDGRVWSRDRVDYTVDTVHRLSGLATGERAFLRVTAINEAGESDPSDVYTARADDAPSSVLIVDGNERWQREPVAENTLGGSHDFLVRYGVALDVDGFDSASNRAVADGAVRLEDYDAVIWAVAEDSEVDDSFDPTEQALVEGYASAGGRLFVSGAEIGWDLVARGDAADAAFYGDTLRAEYLGDDAATFFVTGSGGIFADFDLMGFLTPDDIVVSYPDRLGPTQGSIGLLEYVGGEGGTAAVQYDGAYRLVYFGFPFESIDNGPDRAAVMGAVIDFFEL